MSDLTGLSREEALAECAYQVCLNPTVNRIDDVQTAMSSAGFEFVRRQEAFNALCDAFESLTELNECAS